MLLNKNHTEKIMHIWDSFSFYEAMEGTWTCNTAISLLELGPFMLQEVPRIHTEKTSHLL